MSPNKDRYIKEENNMKESLMVSKKLPHRMDRKKVTPRPMRKQLNSSKSPNINNTENQEKLRDPSILKQDIIQKEQPNYELSGKLTEYTNTYKGVVIKYNQPPDAHKPNRVWRFYQFKNDEELETLYLHRESAFLIGRDTRIVDIPTENPSCSSQHAVFQYRLVSSVDKNGNHVKVVKPYIIDLDSKNGTYLNNERIKPRRYYEMKEKDVLKFGTSVREYVLLHDQSKLQ